MKKIITVLIISLVLISGISVFGEEKDSSDVMDTNSTLVTWCSE